MRKLYTMVNDTLNSINFDEIWSGFHRIDFALYNKEKVYLNKHMIPWDNRFLANTVIDYEGNNLAIWNVENVKEIHYKELAANMVHEMFHAYQFSKNETRFPDDIKALSYPNDLGNYELKHNENNLLIEGLNSTGRNKKLELLKQIIASRKIRVEKFGELIRYEFMIETIEGSAEYCAIKALESISEDLYRKRIEDYKRILQLDKRILFDIRRCCYYTGALFLLFLDELGIKFSKEIENEEITIFEEIEKAIDTNDVIISKTNYSIIKLNFEKEQLKKEKSFNNFFQSNLVTNEGNFHICGYDPMNMIKLDNRILCSNFIILKDIKMKNNVFIKGPTVVEFEEGLESVRRYYIVDRL
ncbi:hypothetical protein [Hathewaya massiliensis]|uniref:hypothetical protein n=1 Tax=Hathewaya massiliensis TaxID=1964382 RepID=UPI00115A1046|nr:hypothetical protein [Hathewaya massiliensis]